VFSTLVILLGLAIGINLRDGALNEVRLYRDVQFGITVFYPAGWSVLSSEAFVFRARNLTERGFPTTFQISVQTAPDTISPRQVFDSISLARLQTLASYNVISSPESIALADGTTAFVIEYAYAESEADPFLERLPAIVRGQDVITIRSGQAITITYLSSEETYETNLPIFQQFLARLRL
jgi:hypothetical protein